MVISVVVSVAIMSSTIMVQFQGALVKVYNDKIHCSMEVLSIQVLDAFCVSYILIHAHHI